MAKCILMTVFSIFVLAVGTPNLEQSRQEARSAQAFILAKQIKTGALPRDTPDPWGMPFKITGSDPGRLIATSYGANMSTPSSGYDDDDVSTNMLLPPHKRAMQRKQRQILATVVLSAIPWLATLGATVYSACKRRSLLGDGAQPVESSKSTA